VRAYNLLNRWCDAVADPRHALISPNAPVINYQTCSPSSCSRGCTRHSMKIAFVGSC
jgi:hypothetical protein